MQAFIREDDWLVAHFSLADVFGDSGTVGLAIFQMTTPQRAELNTFLMSCRVIGREAESAFLHTLLRLLKDQGVKEVVACYHPTPKNGLAKGFLPDQGFGECGDGRYQLDLCKTPPVSESAFPITVELAA